MRFHKHSSPSAPRPPPLRHRGLTFIVLIKRITTAGKQAENTMRDREREREKGGRERERAGEREGGDERKRRIKKIREDGRARILQKRFERGETQGKTMEG